MCLQLRLWMFNKIRIVKISFVKFIGSVSHGDLEMEFICSLCYRVTSSAFSRINFMVHADNLSRSQSFPQRNRNSRRRSDNGHLRTSALFIIVKSCWGFKRTRRLYLWCRSTVTVSEHIATLLRFLIRNEKLLHSLCSLWCFQARINVRIKIIIYYATGIHHYSKVKLTNWLINKIKLK